MESPRPAFDPDRMAVAKAKPAVPREVTVSQLNALIKLLLADSLPGTIHLVGEISNFKRADSGHLYLTLKDRTSEIRAVMWRSAASTVKFKPADGMEVIATGYVDVYEPRGQYQFIIRKLEPRGTGALELAFRQLHNRLAKEGLFEQARKKTPPRFPKRIAVVTSPTERPSATFFGHCSDAFRAWRSWCTPYGSRGKERPRKSRQRSAGSMSSRLSSAEST